MEEQVENLNAAIARFQQAEAAAKARVASLVTSLKQVIEELRSHPAAADLSGQIASIEATTRDLDTIATPEPTETPAETVEGDAGGDATGGDATDDASKNA